MMKMSLLILIVTSLLLPARALALMPPEKMAKRNLQAKLILIGEVTETGSILLPEKTQPITPAQHLFVLKVLHIVKGYGLVKHGEQLRIVYRPAPKSKDGLVAKMAGSLPVEVKAGNLVVVYLDPSEHPGFYKPVVAGSSVVVIAPSLSEELQHKGKKEEQ